MKKLNKLFAILIAVLGVQTLSAQTDVTSTYLTNAGFDDESGWITDNIGQATAHAATNWVATSSGDTWWYGGAVGYGSSLTVNSVTAPATNPEGAAEGGALGLSAGWGCTMRYTQEVTLLAGVYTLSYKAYNANTSATQANNYIGFTSSSVTAYGKTTNFTANTWVEESVNFVLTTTTTGSISVGMGAISNGSGANAKLFVDGVTLTYKSFDEVSAESPANFTSLIVNPSFETGNLDGWTYIGSSDTGVKPNSNGTYTTSGVDGSYLFNTWWKGTPLTQTVANIPNGIYVLNVLVASGDGNNTTPDIYLLANGEHSEVYTISDGDKTVFHDVSYEFKVLNGQATIGVVGGNDDGTYNADGHWWYKADNFRLTYKGADVSLLQEAFAANYAKLEALSTNDIPTAFATQITSLKSTYTTTPSSKAELNTANGEMEAIIAAHPSIVAAYAPLNELITLCSTYVKENYSSVKEENTRSTFTTAISTAITDKENATTAAKLTEAYNTLEAARQTFVLLAYPTSGNSFDMTFKILNAEIVSKDNWETNANLASNVDYTNAPDIYALDRWDAGSTNGTTVYAKQTINNLANGVYTLTAMARGNGADMYYVYATSNDIEYKEVVIGGGNTGNPWGLVTVPNIVVVNGGSMELGLKGTNNNTWFSVDNFKLYRSYDVTAMQSVLTDLLTGANTMASKPMNATIKETLNSTIQATDATATDPATLDNMINALNEAMASAESSINDYAKLKKYIDMTAVFTDVTSYTTKYNNGEYASTDVETTRQELNVLRFEAASLIFPNNIEVTGWEGTMGGKNTGGQHWDGTTGENATKYYDNNSWNGNAHSTTTNITLPAGNYVLKAALRSNENTTLKLTVLDETVNVEGKGDQGYGITINGTASFSPDSTYANDNNGRGWEWEFVKFELADETTVTLTVECDYNGVYGWASFSDITLWMDDATYVTVYGKELDAPLAEAKNLVNTLPMGDAEKAALADAIELGEGEISKPAQLNTAVDALKEAVANANDWRSTYNTEKDKLVAALERFETEFNDGANGALRFIVEWDGLLTAVAEAACAKDITNSYDRFSNAAAALNAAMDAVFEDYLKYEMLEDYTSVIGNADCASNDAWPGSGRANDTKEHWSGTEKTYFKQNHENGAARTQTVTLPKSGTYLLKAAVRAVEAASYVDIIINGKSHKIMGAHGRTGGTIATDGTEWVSVAAGIEAGKTFANDNKGFGWVYQYIYFDAKAGENTIAISLSNTNNNREGNVGGMTLYYLRPNYTIRENNIVKHYGEYTESITAVHTTHDVTNATMSSLAVNVTATPNTLIIANEGQVSNANNVVVDGTAASLVLNDGGYAFNTTADFTATALNYAREFTKDTWLTVCLPFAYPIPENVKVETLGAIDLDTKTFTFDEVTGTMEANTPYLIKNSTETAALFASFGNVEVKATPAAMNVTITAENSTHEGEFIGTYTTMTTNELMEEGTYDILFFGTDGQLYYLSSGITTKNITIKPFRAYIRLPKDAINWSDGQQARVRHRNSAMTDIEGPELDAQGSMLIYDLMGRRVTAIEKGGIYIVNGKKVIVR